MIIGILLFIVLGVLSHFFILHYRRFGRMVNNIPGPQVMPIFGNLIAFQVSSAELWNMVREMNRTYYPIFRLWGFTEPFLNIRHPDDLEKILGNPKSTQKSSIYNLLLPWFNTGLLTSAGRKWQERRKILTPAFHFNVLQQFADIFIEDSERVSKSLKSEGGPVVKDLLPLISEHTLNVICETAMGTSLKDKGAFQTKYRNAVYHMGQLLVYRFLRPWVQNDFLFKFFPEGWRQSKLLGILHGFTKQIIKERKEYHEQTNGAYLSHIADNQGQKKDDMYFGIRKRRLAMLDLLIAAHRNNQIDDEGIREEVDTFMFRGHDTTAMSICFTIMLLAEHKDIQERARYEVTAIMNENDGKMTMAAMANLPYLERCIKESLRLYPSVPFISRSPETDITLSNFLVPANSIVNIHIMDVHRDPKYWPNPDAFDPDRFLPNNIQGRHPYCYVPFSAGPRNCIGQRFAMMELKTVLAYLLYNFHFEPVDYLKDVCINTDLVIRPAHSLRTKFIPIENPC
ncbi:PREDICTED: cytochrome P450 4C1-like [Dufourea novaeangliae]|uniref:Cytochrome P450 4C1 n=1 Tax=Dufourea novaeangliae TaxID=178035 RepID=A0A154PPN0_DUFNO|nr:PREDICTED: cytochrome P450 4C1-like [Dufourea novaeangliae]XP_015436625.1 PREDICTED: cytochrome P450 4C1-like [Dufourea novaeangliae]KZC13846.1 Cytochrome P450 4C1 [Dufourea novaeangliae]